MQELRGQGAFSCWQALRDARADLDFNVPRSFGDCLEWSKRQFNAFFHVSFFFMCFWFRVVCVFCVCVSVCVFCVCFCVCFLCILFILFSFLFLF